MKREPAAGHPDPVTAALQAYAHRGVFRGFRAAAAPRGQVGYEFKWLTRQAMRAEFDPRTQTLRFRSLFPAISKAAAADVGAVIDARGTRTTPGHKRLDARRARFAGSLRGGAFSLTASVRGGNHEYAVKTALNLINEMFVTLQERHPEYLIAQFGMSPE